MARDPVAPVTNPNVESPRLTSGLLKFGVFVALYQSVRNARLNLSVKRMLRKRAASRLKNPGPDSIYLPTLPNVGEPNRSVGSANADVSNHGTVFTPYSFENGPTSSGDWLLPGVFKGAHVQPKFNGEPLTRVQTPLICHPPKIALSGPL